jgi:hypothetical protein
MGWLTVTDDNAEAAGVQELFTRGRDAVDDKEALALVDIRLLDHCLSATRSVRWPSGGSSERLKRRSVVGIGPRLRRFESGEKLTAALA